MNKKHIIGYVRVSTIDQNPDRQLKDIELDRVYVDYASGRNTDRKELKNMLSYIRNGDHVVVDSIDRIARNLMDLKNLVKTLNEKGISIEFKKEKLYFSPEKQDIHSNLMLNMLGAFAEFEHAIITERRLEGMRLAKKAGRVGGRRRILTSEQEAAIKADFANHIKAKDLIEKYGVSKSKIYSVLGKIKQYA